MSNDEVILTRTGYKKLERELNKLIHVDTPKMAERLEEVRSTANNGEEPAFADAMSDQERLEARIAHLRRLISSATVLEDDPDPESVSPGNRVTVRDEEYGDEVEFDVLGGHEVVHSGRRGVTLNSPVGKALLGQKVGTTVKVKVPDGTAKYTILKIGLIPEDES